MTLMRDTTASGFLQGNFLLSMSFQGLVALLLFFDPHQIVLGTSFQRLLVLKKSEQFTDQNPTNYNKKTNK